MVKFVSFPHVNNANDDGLLAMGGDLTLDTLVSAYAQGVFPWFNDDQPILWWSPDPRLVLYPDEVKISRSLRKTIRQKRFSLSCNQAFERVIKACALRGPEVPFATPPDTWITDSMHHAYLKLHRQSYAHSIEVWQDKELVGGIYGVALGNVFFGESMFSSVNNASKVGLVALCHWLKTKGFAVVDCQVASNHLFSMGAQEIPRSTFIQYLESINLEQALPDFATDFKHSKIEDAIKTT
jgi:leucyl/phenylalanyl-tRNA--protein transferase